MTVKFNFPLTVSYMLPRKNSKKADRESHRLILKRTATNCTLGRTLSPCVSRAIHGASNPK